MRIQVLLCFLLLLPGTAWAGAPLTVTLPSADSYSYWVQSESGAITVLPATIREKAAVTLKSVRKGDRVFVLDAHNGQAASHAVEADAGGKLTPIRLTTADFHPIFQPIATAPASSPGTTAAAIAPLEKSPASPEEDQPSGPMRLLTSLISVLLALVVAWVLVHLVRSRGEPLRALARKAGVDVPEPKPLEEAEAAPAAYVPTRRAPEAVPDEAGLPPLPVQTRRGPEIALTGGAALQGVQGLAAGSTFALTDGDVTVGRDGDNEIVLAENTVSRRHARLFRESSGQFTLTDLGSANGVYVNGMRVQRAILSAGDEIKIGDNYFRFHSD